MEPYKALIIITTITIVINIVVIITSIIASTLMLIFFSQVDRLLVLSASLQALRWAACQSNELPYIRIRYDLHKAFNGLMGA